MIKRFFYFWIFLLPLAFSLSPAFSEDVKITTYYPSPYGSYKQLNIENLDESSSITDFTQSLTRAGLNIISEYSSGAYTPGIFWSTVNDNPTKPKAGIWMHEATNASRLHFGTSNSYSTGITNNALVLDSRGYAGIGQAPGHPLDVALVNPGNTAAKIGPSLPVYVKSGPTPSIGFNATWPVAEGGPGPAQPTFTYGAGSANNYAATLSLSSTTGALTISTYNSPGNAGESITGPRRIVIDANGNVATGITDAITSPAAPQAALDINSDGGAILVPRKSTTGDPTNPVNGMIYYNSTDDKFRVYEDGSWKDMSTGNNIACSNVTTTIGGTSTVALTMIVNGRNICEDVSGCSVKLWTTTAAKPAGNYFYGDSTMEFHQALSGGNHHWHFSYADRTGINGDNVKDTIAGNNGIYLYDDEPAAGGENSYNSLTVIDSSASYGGIVTICDV